MANTLPDAVGDDLANFIVAARLYGVTVHARGRHDRATTTKPAQSDMDAVTAQIATDRAERHQEAPEDQVALEPRQRHGQRQDRHGQRPRRPSPTPAR